MKKRSLVAALAMLMVSAIVLTSSTYAWFAASNTASVTGIQATTGNSAGSIYISANGSDWATSLTQTNFAAETNNAFASALTPVSFDVNNKAWFTGNFSQADGSTTSTLTAAAASTDALKTSYIKFTVFMYAEVACTVTVTPTLTSQCGYVYGALNNNGTYTLFGAVNNSYNPIASAGTANDNVPVDGIIDATEAAAGTLTLGTGVTVPSTQTLTYTFTADQVGEGNQVSFDVYVWAEGQDEDCFGTVDTDTVQLTLGLEKVDTPTQAA